METGSRAMLILNLEIRYRSVLSFVHMELCLWGKKIPCTEWTVRGSNDGRDTRFSSPPNAEPFEINRTTDIVDIGQNDMQWVAPCFVSGWFWVRILATTSDSLILYGMSIRPQTVPSTSFLILQPLPFLQLDAL